MFCQFGFKKVNGCEICQCNEKPREEFNFIQRCNINCNSLIKLILNYKLKILKYLFNQLANLCSVKCSVSSDSKKSTDVKSVNVMRSQVRNSIHNFSKILSKIKMGIENCLNRLFKSEWFHHYSLQHLRGLNYPLFSFTSLSAISLQPVLQKWIPNIERMPCVSVQGILVLTRNNEDVIHLCRGDKPLFPWHSFSWIIKKTINK